MAMALEQAERFLVAAEHDYAQRVDEYGIVARGQDSRKGYHTEDVVMVREARADVLAAQQVRDLARLELRWAQQDRREREAAQEERVRQEEGR